MNPLNMDLNLRSIFIPSTIDGLEKYLDVTEAQMEESFHLESHTLEAEAPKGMDEETYQEFCRERISLRNLYEEDLRPSLRYSFLILLHIVFETQLRVFCADLKNQRGLPIGMADLRGGAIDQAFVFLTKIAGLEAQNLPEWQHLRTLQKVRDCAVHCFGYVKESRDKKFLNELASKGTGVTIDGNGRIGVQKLFL